MSNENQTEGTSIVHPAVATDPYVMRPIGFHFKKSKDAEGKDTGFKRPSITLNIPVPSARFVASILTEGIGAYQHQIPEGAAIPPEIVSKRKQLDLLLEAMNDVIYVHARTQVNADDKISQETLDMSKLSWEFIANIPPTERRGTGISDDTWQEFVKDYITIMPDVLRAQGMAKRPDQIEAQAQLFAGKLNKAKNQKQILSYLRSLLAMWYQHTQAKEEFQAMFEYLDGRAETMLKADETALLQNI